MAVQRTVSEQTATASSANTSSSALGRLFLERKRLSDSLAHCGCELVSVMMAPAVKTDTCPAASSNARSGNRSSRQLRQRRAAAPAMLAPMAINQSSPRLNSPGGYSLGSPNLPAAGGADQSNYRPANIANLYTDSGGGQIGRQHIRSPVNATLSVNNSYGSRNNSIYSACGGNY